jgi:hypothetical protein
MPRISRQLAAPARKPKLKQPPPTEPHLLNQQRGAVAELVALGRTKEDVHALMMQAFPTIDVKSIERMRVAAQRAFEQGVVEGLHVARAKQEDRVRRLIGRARTAKDLDAEIKAEGLYAKLKGTLAPREIVITADASTRDALAAVLSILPRETLTELAGGRWVPLGHVGPNGLPPITVEGVSDADE